MDEMCGGAEYRQQHIRFWHSILCRRALRLVFSRVKLEYQLTVPLFYQRGYTWQAEKSEAQSIESGACEIVRFWALSIVQV